MILEPLLSESWPFGLRNHTLVDQLLHHRFHRLVLLWAGGAVLLHAHMARTLTLTHTHSTLAKV